MTTPVSSSRGIFITFEGIEGCGKTTQLGRLARALGGGRREVLCTREPGGTELGRELRAILLRPDGASIGALAELLVYTADRAQHLEQIVVPALERGAIVLCDRYLDATLAYQGHARGLDLGRIEALHAEPPLDLRPDRTLLLDLEPVQSLDRARQRNRGSADAGREGRFEDETLAFHRRVHEGYRCLARADPDRIRIVDALGEPAVVASRVLQALDDLPLLRESS